MGDADLLMNIDIETHNIDEIMEADVYDEEMQEAIKSHKNMEKSQ